MGIIVRLYVGRKSEEADWVGQRLSRHPGEQESWREDHEGCSEPQAAGEASVVEVSGLFVGHPATNVTVLFSCYWVAACPSSLDLFSPSLLLLEVRIVL